MEKILETKKLLLFEEASGKRKIVYRQLKEDAEENKVKIYEKSGKTITYFFESDSWAKIILKGYDEIPDKIFNPFGFGFKEKSINNFFKYKLKTETYDTLVIADKEVRTKKNQLFFFQDELEELFTSINQEQRACNDTKAVLINNFLVNKYPGLKLDHKDTNNNKDLILRNLNPKLIDKLTAEEVEQIGSFYVDAAKKYSRPDIVKRMIKSLQKSTRLLTLQEIIKIYEKHLDENPHESEWQFFFDDYITLFDNRYVRKLDYKNIATGLTKYPDLVLVDIYGYVDFYELKKSGMPLLQYDNSHKTFYWSKDVSMVIAQVSDYLQKARENAMSYAKTIKEETATGSSVGLEVNIIHPRAIIVAGRKTELNTAKKRNHFKTLRESLKDIEFVVYDDLLDRLKNLVSSLALN